MDSGVQLLTLRWPAGAEWAYLARTTQFGLRFIRFIDLEREPVFAALTRGVHVRDADGMCEVNYPATSHDQPAEQG